MTSQLELTVTKPESKGVDIAAIGGGGSLGTIIVALAQLIPETSDWRTIVIMIAPAITVGITGLWSYAVAERSKNQEQENTQALIDRSRRRLNQKINDPNTSPEMKQLYEEQLKALEEKAFKIEIEQIS